MLGWMDVIQVLLQLAVVIGMLATGTGALAGVVAAVMAHEDSDSRGYRFAILVTTMLTGVFLLLWRAMPAVF